MITDYTAQGVYDKIVRCEESFGEDKRFQNILYPLSIMGLEAYPLIDISSMSAQAWDWFFDPETDEGSDGGTLQRGVLPDFYREPFPYYFLLSSRALYCMDSDKSYINVIIPPSRDQCSQASAWSNFIINPGEHDSYRSDEDVFHNQVRADLKYFYHVFNQVPDITYVSAGPAKQKRYKKAMRYHQRERILNLSKKQLRRIYPQIQGEVGKKAPHFRRGYWRRYTNERFSEERRAKCQWVAPIWVGEKEVTHKGVRYRVRLDL